MIFLTLLWLLAGLWGVWLADADHPRRVEARRWARIERNMDSVTKAAVEWVKAMRGLSSVADDFGTSARKLADAIGKLEGP